MRLNFPPRPTATIRCGALDLDERHVGPAEALQRRVDAEARARAAADRVDPRQAPVLQVVVAELGVVRDVREVVEDLLAGTGDRDGDGDGVHGGRKHSRRGAAQAARGRDLTARSCSGECTTLGARRGPRGAEAGRARTPAVRRRYGRPRRRAEYDGSAAAVAAGGQRAHAVAEERDLHAEGCGGGSGRAWFEAVSPRAPGPLQLTRSLRSEGGVMEEAHDATPVQNTGTLPRRRPGTLGSASSTTPRAGSAPCVGRGGPRGR